MVFFLVSSGTDSFNKQILLDELRKGMSLTFEFPNWVQFSYNWVDSSPKCSFKIKINKPLITEKDACSHHHAKKKQRYHDYHPVVEIKQVGRGRSYDYSYGKT